MLEEAVENFLRQIQSLIVRRPIFQQRDDPERLQIVFERFLKRLHTRCHRLFSGMTEGCVTEVVRQRDRFRQIFIESECSRDVAADLRDFQRVRNARSVVIAVPADEHLRLVLQPPKRLRVQDAVSIALERKPRRVFRLGMYSAESLTVRDGVGGKE